MVAEGQNFKTVRNQLENINLVESIVEIHGKHIPFASLTLEQKFNAHHVMQLRVNYEALFENGFMATPEDVIKLIGEKISLRMKHRITGSYNLFFGLVTDAVIEGTKGTDNNILITAKSTSIRLDGKKSMDSFCNCFLEGIVNDTLRTSGNNEEMVIKPTFEEEIDYICQYNETAFEFFNRLSYIYGEWFWNDGTMTHFGRGDISSEKSVELTYDVDMLDFRLRARLTPAKFNRYNYLVHNDSEISAPAPKDVPGLRGYLQYAVDQSDLTFQAEGDRPCDAAVLSSDELERLVRIERSRAVGEMLTVEGTSRTSEVQIGKIVKLKMPYNNLPIKEVEQFLVTGVTHYIDELGHYSNTFTGIISGLEAIPMTATPTSYAYPQPATVMDNADPDNKGRVQVQLQWQKYRGKHTNWIRVATPDAGSSGRVPHNRGFVFIPEMGDQVMIGFEYGDPDRPYVMSSLFTELTDAGGGANNNTKSIITRRGIKIVCNDGNGSVYIEDPSGNIVKLNGNKAITITAPRNITLDAGENMNINVGKDLILNVGNNQTANIGNAAFMNVMRQIMVSTPFMQQLISDYFHTQAGKALINSQNEVKIESPETSVVGEQKLFMHSAEKAVVNSQGTMEIRGEQGTTDFNNALVYQLATEKKAKTCVVYFKRNSGYGGEYGFDWFRIGENPAKGVDNFVNTIGRHYIINKNGQKETDPDGNHAYKSPFEVLPSQVNKKENSYERFIIDFKLKKTPTSPPWNPAAHTYTYYVPRLSMMAGTAAKPTTATIMAQIELDSEATKPKKIELELNKTDGLKLSTTSLPVINGEKVNITITCTGELNEQRTITVKADGDECGKLIILPNSARFQRNVKVLFVNVITRLDTRKRPKSGNPKPGSIKLFRNVLKQALIKSSILIGRIDCTEPAFKTNYTTIDPTDGRVIKSDIATSAALRRYLMNKFTAKYGSRYNGYYTVFFFGDKSKNTNGYSYFNTTFGAFFDGHNAATVSHEMLHALGLPHTFDFHDTNRSDFGYRYHTTDNIMDYSHHHPNPIDRICLFYWQWKKINPKII